MSRSNLVLVVATAAVSSLLTYLACTTGASPPGALQAPTRAAAHDVMPNYPGVANAGVLTEASAPRATTVLPPASSPPTATPTAPAPDPAVTLEKQQEMGKQLAQLFNAGKADAGALGAKIENRFYREEWNQEWADSKESNIRALFQSNDDLGGMEPLQVTCRSQNCQVVLPASSQDQARRLSEKFMQVARTADVGMNNQMVAFFPDVSTGRLVFYLSEGGNTDLFH